MQNLPKSADKTAPSTHLTTSATADVPASTYARRTVDRLTEATRKPDQDLTIWDLVHLYGILSWLDVMGHGDSIREACDRAAADYRLPAQSTIDAPAPLLLCPTGTEAAR